MFKKIFSILAIAMLASCKPSPQEGADGYKFGTPQFQKTSFQVNVVVYEDRKQLLVAAKKYGITIPDVLAFSVLRPPFDVCTIHMVSPSYSYEPEYIGHEFAHCMYGQWHTNNDSKS